MNGVPSSERLDVARFALTSRAGPSISLGLSTTSIRSRNVTSFPGRQFVSLPGRGDRVGTSSVCEGGHMISNRLVGIAFSGFVAVVACSTSREESPTPSPGQIKVASQQCGVGYPACPSTGHACTVFPCLWQPGGNFYCSETETADISQDGYSCQDLSRCAAQGHCQGGFCTNTATGDDVYKCVVNNCAVCTSGPFWKCTWTAMGGYSCCEGLGGGACQGGCADTGALNCNTQTYTPNDGCFLRRYCGP
jgi:hypothetical protein